MGDDVGRYVQRSKSDESAVISHEISQGLIPSNYTALTRPARNGPSLPGRNTNPRIVILAYLFLDGLVVLSTVNNYLNNNQPFIVLTETKFSYRYIPVWARYSPHRTRVEAHANMLSP